MDQRGIWRASGLDGRFLMIVGLTLVCSPFVSVVLGILFSPDAVSGRSELFREVMIVLIAGAYGLAESVYLLPTTILFTMAGWLMLYLGGQALSLSQTNCGRAAAFAAGVGGSLGYAWHLEQLGPYNTNRVLDRALGGVPVAALLGWLFFPSDVRARRNGSGT